MMFVFGMAFGAFVSVPLRGKEGAGHQDDRTRSTPLLQFPSPCGVRRVRDVEGLQPSSNLEVCFRPLAG